MKQCSASTSTPTPPRRSSRKSSRPCVPFSPKPSATPAPRTHGQHARSAVEHARASVATLLHATPKEIVFTSGGTETDNLALSGILQPFLDANEPAHLITARSSTTPSSTPLKPSRSAASKSHYLAPNADGLIDPAAFEAALRPHTRLVSIMLANNETGAIQPIGKLARIAKAHNPALVFHTDAVQAAAKLPTRSLRRVQERRSALHLRPQDVRPQGTGVLFVRKGVQLAPLFHGGPHERQRRAGTENVPGIVALGRAAELAAAWLDSRSSSAAQSPHRPPRTRPPRRHPQRYGQRRRRSAQSPTPPTCASPASTPNRSSSRLICRASAASFGAACMSGATEPSHVLLAMGLTPAEARSSLRLSLSRLTTAQEIDRALEIIPAAVARLRSLS